MLWMTSLLVMMACAQQQKVTYEFPKEMLDDVKVAYKEECDRGQVLYDLNCGKCHTSYKGRKKIVPDFDDDQLTGYTLRESNMRHTESLPDSLVSEEDLIIIMTFLRYKTRNE